MDALEEPWRIPKSTFFKGMAELLEKGFLAKSANPNMFFLNPAMMWNGDRFRFVQEYQRASSVAARGQLRLNEIDPKTGEIKK
jgi:DNA-binding IclR family transcriptional regulator